MLRFRLSTDETITCQIRFMDNTVFSRIEKLREDISKIGGNLIFTLQYIYDVVYLEGRKEETIDLINSFKDEIEKLNINLSSEK